MSDRRLDVNLDDVAEAMDTRFDGMTEWFLDTRTGAVHPIDEEDHWEDAGGGTNDERDVQSLAAQVRDDEEERCVAIPQTESHEAYRLMEDFISRVTDRGVHERLAEAITGKGAFRRFKDTLLRYPNVREQWFEFETNTKRQWAADWLRSQGIESTWKPPSIVGE